MRQGTTILVAAVVLAMWISATRGGADDFYLFGGRPVFLERDPSLVGMDVTSGVVPAALRALRLPDGLSAPGEIVVSLPRPGRYVCRVESFSDSGRAPAAAALPADAGIQRVYPVFRNPKNGLMIFVFDEVIVCARPGITVHDLLRFGARWNVSLAEQNPFEPDIYLLRVGAADGSTLDVANAYALGGLCQWAEPNFGGQIHKCDVNDPLFGQQWHLYNFGQTGGTPDADVDGPEAWRITPGSPQVVIALLDDGCDLTHEDLRDNLWTNPREIAGNRIDDDHNGYEDDVHGWDFFDNDNDPSHETWTGSIEGHGTATAGLAAAAGNNARGVAGMAYGCKILPVKIFKGNEYAGNYEVGKAIRYAARHADVLSNSWGGGPRSETVESALRYAVAQGRGGRGCPVFFAAGNSSSTEVEYPALSLWTIAVGATDSSDRKYNYSSFGSRLTLMAPSGNYTTDRSGIGVGYDGGYPDFSGNYTGQFGGTSAACPIGAGTGALLLSLNPNLVPLQVQSILQNTSDKVSPADAQYNADGFSLRYGYGRLNAARALKRVEQGVVLDDPFEPNNTLAGARRLEKGFYSALACLNDDWFAADLQPAQNLLAEIYFLHVHGNLQLELYDSQGALLAASKGTTNTETVEANSGETSGRFYIRVFGEAGAANYYHLILNKRPPDDAFEPNDTLATARPIAPGDYNNLRGFDPDYYRVRVRSGEKLSALIRFFNDLGDLDLYLLDGTGTILDAAATLADVEGVWYRNKGPDTDLYLFVDNYNDSESSYTLHVDVRPGQDDAFEPNDSQPQAVAIGPGVYAGLQGYNEDWFKTIVGPRQRLEVETRFFNAIGDLDLDMFDAQGHLVDFSAGVADFERVLFINTANSTATVLFVVYPFVSNYPHYILEVRRTNLTDDGFEPNEDFARSRVLPTGTRDDLMAMNPDFFSVGVPRGVTLAALLADESSLPRLAVALYTPTGIPLASTTPGEPALVIAPNVPVMGYNRVVVTGASDGAANPYALTLLTYDSPATPTVSEDRFEPNDYRHQARTVTEGAYANLLGANTDYYRIRLNAGDTLLAGIAYNSLLADLDLVVLDPYGQLLSSSSRAENVDLCSVQRVPLAGWYYIRVQPSLLGSGKSHYDLLIGKTVDRTKLGARRWGAYR